MIPLPIYTFLWKNDATFHPLLICAPAAFIVFSFVIEFHCLIIVTDGIITTQGQVEVNGKSLSILSHFSVEKYIKTKQEVVRAINPMHRLIKENVKSVHIHDLSSQ